MRSQEAKRIVHDTFNKPYDEGRMRYLVRNLFPNAEERNDSWSDQTVPETFQATIQQYQRLGVYEDTEGLTIDVLAVSLRSRTQLERARTAQRNFIARYLSSGERDAALVAFYSNDEDDWRFSLVRMDYSVHDGKLKKELTPARRYSFLVGPNEGTHTAEQQLSTLLTDETALGLGNLESAFNIETVTKEFFERYKRLFLSLKEELDILVTSDLRVQREFTSKDIDTATFAKRLLGQIVFLYFLQKKGWLGVEKGKAWGSGPKNFLRQLFENSRFHKNFFDDVLEPLFYKALAEKNEGDLFAELDCKIPFLNGGLFEPVGGYNWEETRINLQNETFEQIFDTFDLYNFTVREDEPLDKEVAVDPEMLGKVFENLLEVRDRKSKGAFYTPREIVHYMCQESLINYLDTALNTVTRPLAKQAPAQDDLFGKPQTWQAPLTEEVYEERAPRADLAEFIRLGDAAHEHDGATAAMVPGSVRQHAAAIDKAFANIKICDPAIGSGAFPVGMMNEIVQARGALNEYLGNEGRTAYDFKRHAIQESIYGVDIEESAVDIAKLRLWLSLVVDEDDYGTIKPLPNLEYKIVVGNSLLGVEETLFNNELFERLEALKGQYFSETRQGEKGRLKGEIAALIGELTQGEVDFDFKVYFSEVFQEKGGFDVVVGNPPYVNAWEMEREDPQQRGRIKAALKQYSFLTGHWDLFIAFVAKGHQVSRVTGTLSYIVPNPILREKYATSARRFLIQKMMLQKILEFNDVNMFEQVARRTTVFVAQHKQVAGYEATISSNVAGQIVEKACINTDHWLKNHNSQILINQQQTDDTLIEKLEGLSDRIGNYMYVNYGAQVSSKAKGAFGKKDVIFRESREGLKEFYEGKDVQRWKLSFRGLYLDYRGSDFYGPRDPKLFESPKIAVRKVSNKGHRIAATYDCTGRYTDDGNVLVVPYRSVENTSLRTIFEGFIKKDAPINLKYVLAILLCKVQSFYFRRKFATESLQGSTSHTYPNSVRNLLLPVASPERQQSFANLVERVLSLHDKKGQGAEARLVEEIDAEIRRTDAEIDRLVYELYGLTDEEIRVVEGK